MLCWLVRVDQFRTRRGQATAARDAIAAFASCLIVELRREEFKKHIFAVVVVYRQLLSSQKQFYRESQKFFETTDEHFFTTETHQFTIKKSKHFVAECLLKLFVANKLDMLYIGNRDLATMVITTRDRKKN